MKGYLYNPYKDVLFSFGGRTWEFPAGKAGSSPRGKVTEIDDATFTAPDLVKRNAETDSNENAMLTYTVTGYELAQKFMNRHQVNRFAQGFWVGQNQPTDKEKSDADKRAKKARLDAISAAQKDRALAKAGKPGRMEFDDYILDFMKEEGIKDDFYDTVPGGGGLSKEILEAIGAAAGAAAAQAVAAGRK